MNAKASLDSISLVVVISFGCMLLCTGCSTNGDKRTLHTMNSIDPEDAYYWGRATFLTKNAPMSPPTGDICNQVNDKSLGVEYRRYLAALLFAGYLAPGFDTLKVHESLQKSEWLNLCHLTWVGSAGGYQPLLLTGTHFRLALFPDEKGYSPWVIYFTLSPHITKIQRENISVEQAHAFLTGNGGPDTIITEFVLFYPLPGGGW